MHDQMQPSFVQTHRTLFYILVKIPRFPNVPNSHKIHPGFEYFTQHEYDNIIASVNIIASALLSR